MYQFILLIHVFAAVFIVGLVLLQQGKGATIGAAFGSGASQTVFGSRGSGSFLFRITISLGVIFFITSIGLNYMATERFKQERAVALPLTSSPDVPVRKSPATVSPDDHPVPVTPASPNKEQALPSEIPVRK